MRNLFYGLVGMLWRPKTLKVTVDHVEACMIMLVSFTTMGNAQMIVTLVHGEKLTVSPLWDMFDGQVHNEVVPGMFCVRRTLLVGGQPYPDYLFLTAEQLTKRYPGRNKGSDCSSTHNGLPAQLSS
jgi:hypothetical protein